MANRDHLPEWQLPPGVTRGVWDYTRAAHIVNEYDNPIPPGDAFEFDERVLERYFVPPGKVADLGCGTGRALAPLVRRGLKGLAIDLSEKMLDVVRERALNEKLEIECLQANLVELDAVPPESVEYAMCLFSTLGMIQTRPLRQQALAHVRRILKPNGVFVLHVHNYWFNLFDPKGPWWLTQNLLRSAFVGDVEKGDKFFHYRGIPNMFLHVFTRRELLRDLQAAQLSSIEIIPLATNRQRALAHPWFLGNLRASGWIVACRRN